MSYGADGTLGTRPILDILKERGFDTTGMTVKVAHALLEKQPDFMEQKSCLQELIENLGGFFLFASEVPLRTEFYRAYVELGEEDASLSAEIFSFKHDSEAGGNIEPSDTEQRKTLAAAHG